LLREVLGRIEAAKMKITLVAVDGFTGWLSPEDVDRSDWILALEADGMPLRIGQQGPLWLINTRAEGGKPGDDGRGRWVWAVFDMRVGKIGNVIGNRRCTARTARPCPAKGLLGAYWGNRGGKSTVRAPAFIL
jgi:hypothetical protein